ncbi:MAG: hypothetical protein WBO46_18100 [Caldilineaceae bacterium]
MNEQLSDQFLENLAAPGEPIVPPQTATALLARIDAILDELYAMRQTVRQWADAESDASVNNADLVQEPVKKLVRDATEKITIASKTQHTDTPLTDSLFGAAGQGTWDEVYTNTEIVHMRFGEE